MLQLPSRPWEVVFYAAVFRAFKMAKSRTQEAIESMQKGQLASVEVDKATCATDPSCAEDTDALTSFHLDITFAERKFSFSVTRKRSDVYCFTINGGTLRTKVREQPDGSLYVSVGRLSQQLKGQEEALGLRLIIGAQTIMVPNVYDPSELRSDVNGKVVRYLHEEGTEIAKGETFVELEAMKMIMALKSPEAGKVSHALAAGSIVSAGELLAKLELKDPSKVKKISPFEGQFTLGATEEEPVEPLQDLLALLDGFCIESKGPEVVQKMFEGFASHQAAAETVRGVLEKYLSNERPFAASIDKKQPYDQLLMEIINQGKDDLEKVLFMIAAHNKLTSRSEAVMAILREMVAAEGSGMSCMYVPDMREEEMDGGVHQKVLQISQLPSTAAVAGDYGNVRHLAQQLLDVLPQETYEQRLGGLQAQLRTLDSQVTLQGSKASVPLNFLHVVLGKDAFPSVTDRTLFYNTDAELKKVLKQSQEWDIFAKKAELLKAAGVGEICLVLPQPPRHPRFAKFVLDEQEDTAEIEFSEQEMGRDMWPSFTGMLELSALKRIYSLQRIHKEARPTSHIYLATQPVVGGKAPAPELLMRALYLSKINKESLGQCLADSLDVALDEVEHAMLDPRVSKLGPMTSRIFLHFLSELDMAQKEIEQLFTDSISSHMGHRSSDMIKLCIDQIEVKVHQRTSTGFEILRLSLSSLHGGFLKPKLLREIPDPVTGYPLRWEAADGVQSTITDHPHVADHAQLSRYQAKRVAARRAGSSYAYDLPGARGSGSMLQLALTMKWIIATGSVSDATVPNAPATGSRRRSPSPSRQVNAAEMPKEMLKATELVMDWNKMELVEMLGLYREKCFPSSEGLTQTWRLTITTVLEVALEGRELILISNDVTFQAGSFGDQFFQKASEFARLRGLPRIYVSCNSGARVGLVEELKPLFKARVKWLDPSDCNKGFEYLYLLKQDRVDYEKLPAGTVEAHKVSENGEDRYVLDAIIGEAQLHDPFQTLQHVRGGSSASWHNEDGMKSTQGGIGVENLQGSGLIAGETSRAYQAREMLRYCVSSPMILTGYGALNKLLGKNVYSSQDQLGGPQIMVPNGVTHQVVQDDQEGMSAILDWLSFVPKDISSPPPMCQIASDPWDRDVEFEPSPYPYDPRDFLRGVIDYEGRRMRGFFDAGSWSEYLEGWGQTVIVGRARLGGIPMGVIAVETRSVDRWVPADPSNPESSEVKETMGGKAQALKDFNRGENLPVMIFANWRGFSGGTRDMYNEILKFGAMIVDALVDYQHPIFIYIPKHGELRGGAWVVIDPAINPDKMETGIWFSIF
eukprot:Skav227072  [mRNA]  locus=scaffold4434:1758:15971:+ [translate_table: standard]